VHRGIWWQDVMEGGHFDDPDLDGRIILKWIFKKCCGGVMDRT